MVAISVLMSVYNETKEELIDSLESVLQQTFEDFEFIIVNDNPKNSELIALLREYRKKDSRIKLIFNERNLGLALSMNEAAELAHGKYILRTDADDICVQDRFAKQYEIIEKYNYDLVCSNYYFIDEKGKLIDREVYHYNSISMGLLLPIHNVIHHPTVIMTTEAFKKVGGYRNYLCAQDYDLWLRMLLKNHKFYMMKEKLLYYKVRNNSITGKNKLKQIYTIEYIQRNFKEAKKNNIDRYDYDQYLHYLEKNNVNQQEEIHRFNQQFDTYHQSIRKLKNKHLYEGTKQLIKVYRESTYYRKSFLKKIKYQISRFLLNVIPNK